MWSNLFWDSFGHLAYGLGWLVLRILSVGRYPSSRPTRTEEEWTAVAGLMTVLLIFVGFMFWNNRELAR